MNEDKHGECEKCGRWFAEDICIYHEETAQYLCPGCLTGVGDRVLVSITPNQTVPGEVVGVTDTDLDIRFDANFADELGYDRMSVGRADGNWEPVSK